MKILLTGAFNYNEEQLNRIRSLGYEIIFWKEERLPLCINTADIDAVVCNGLFLYNDITGFKNLRHIQLTSAGLDRVPLDYIEKHGIGLFNARGVYGIPMAEWTMLKILEIYKKSRPLYKDQIEHKWEKHRDLLELTDKTAVVIGFGDVGTEIAKRLKVFGVYVMGVDKRKIESEIIDECYMIDRLDEVLKKSDIVIVALPLTAETRHLIDNDRIDKMKDNSIIINISRGEVIDESALVEALKRNKFLGAALDVFEVEPLAAESPLWDLENVIITPHNSYVSDRISERLFELIVMNLVQSINK